MMVDLQHNVNRVFVWSLYSSGWWSRKLVVPCGYRTSGKPSEGANVREAGRIKKICSQVPREI